MLPEFEALHNRIRELQQRLGSEHELPGDLTTVIHLCHQLNNQAQTAYALQYLRNHRQDTVRSDLPNA